MKSQQILISKEFLLSSVKFVCELMEEFSLEGDVTGSGGSKGNVRPTAQKFLNCMQFFGKFGKIIRWVGAPSYGQSWTHP